MPGNPTDLASRLRAIVRPPGATTPAPTGRRELTYEPDDGRRFEATLDLEQIAYQLGGRIASNAFGHCLVVERRYESDRWHGDVQIGDCEPGDLKLLRVLDPALNLDGGPAAPLLRDEPLRPAGSPNPVFIDLETTGLSGGAGTIAFLVGCGFFDLGAFQVRQFLLTSYSAERALLAAAGELLGDADLIVTYNGKTFDVPVMETRWAFHRMRAPLDEVPHFDMLHPARRLWRSRATTMETGGCRLSTLERVLLNMRRVGDVDGFEIPSRFFHFLRTADPRPLEPVLEHNRLDLVSLAAVTSRALRLTASGEAGCRDGREALALGRVLERAGVLDRAASCYARAAASSCLETRAEALYRLGLRARRERRFADAALTWRELMAVVDAAGTRPDSTLVALRQFALEALAIHHEHRVHDLGGARELALFALESDDASPRADSIRHRLARLERKLARRKNAQLFS
jgi:hypothetical protein